jgi:chemotaxis protein CheD
MKSLEPKELARSSTTIARVAPCRHEQQIIVDVGDLQVTDLPEAVLATYALGSCVGISVYDPLARVGGLLHCQLPAATMNPERARERPAMFADTGLVALIRAVMAIGGQKRRLQVKLAGAAQMLGDDRVFNIGRRNYAAVRKALWQEGLLIDREDIGGTVARTMFVHVADGGVFVKSGSEMSRL